MSRSFPIIILKCGSFVRVSYCKSYCVLFLLCQATS